MGRSRLEASAVALREQQSMRQREASVAAALQIAEEHHQQQLAARQAARREAVGESTSILRTAAAEKQRLSSLLNERRSKLWALLDLERKEAETTLRKMQHNALLKEHDIMRRAGALKEKREKERTEQDNRLLALRRHREEENVRSQESTLRLLEVNAANDFQIDSKYRRQLDQKREDAVFEALWTEDLNAKRLRERRDIEAKLRKTEQIRKSLCEQITKRRQEREKALATLKLEKEQEACRLHKDLELAARHRSLQQAEAAKKRKEMDHALAQQLKERRQRQLEEAALERQQLAAQARLGLMAEERAFLMKTMENENAKHIRLLMEREKQKQLKELRELDYLYIQEQVTAEDRKELEVQITAH
ncbi:hypothetical protein Efla_001134 [Eimeria flavescens]